MKGNWTKSLGLLTLAAAVLLTSAAFADTVVLTPDNLALNGWSLDVYNGAVASIRDVSIQCAYPVGRDPVDPTKFIYNFASPAGGPLPYGALYGETREAGSTFESPDSGQVWCGMNQLSGRYLRDITRLEYDTWTLSSGQDKDTFNHFVHQPFQIQIVYRKNGPTDPNWRYLMHRPWGYVDYPAGYNQQNPYNTWVGNHWDAMQGVWWDLLGNRVFANLQAVLNAYPNAYIDTPPGGKGTAYETGLQTGTGFSFNLEVGARKIITNIFGLTGFAWWQESNQFVGCVDNLTIGVRSVPGDPTSTPIETTYDFEPTDRPDPSTLRKVVINNRDAKARVNRTGKYTTRYVVVGYVQAPDADYVVGSTFKIGDCNTAGGALAPGYVVKVICPGHTNMPGELVRVEGMLDEITTPAILMTTVDNIIPISTF